MGGIGGLDSGAGRINLMVGGDRGDSLTARLTRNPDWPLETKVLAAAVSDVIEDQCGPRRYRAVDDLLSGAAPRLNGIDGDILCGGEPVAGAIAAAHAMDQTLLPIQGPPGTGKTHVTARVILALVKAGTRVAVASNSKDAIPHVLRVRIRATEE